MTIFRVIKMIYTWNGIKLINIDIWKKKKTPGPEHVNNVTDNIYKND